MNSRDFNEHYSNPVRENHDLNADYTEDYLFEHSDEIVKSYFINRMVALVDAKWNDIIWDITRIKATTSIVTLVMPSPYNNRTI